MRFAVNIYFCGPLAQVAELVDALVSNTNEVTRAGSSPALGTKAEMKVSAFFILNSPITNKLNFLFEKFLTLTITLIKIH